MAKRGVFFQLYLSPQNPRDEKIIQWLNTVPHFRRSQRVKDILSSHIQGAVAAVDGTDRAPTCPDAGRLATRLLASLPKRRA